MKTKAALTAIMLLLACIHQLPEAKADDDNDNQQEILVMAGLHDYNSPPYIQFTNDFVSTLIRISERNNGQIKGVSGAWIIAIVEELNPRRVAITAIEKKAKFEPIPVATVSLEVQVTPAGLEAAVQQTIAVLKKHSRKFL